MEEQVYLYTYKKSLNCKHDGKKLMSMSDFLDQIENLKQNEDICEIRLCDMLDIMLFHYKDGKMLFPNITFTCPNPNCHKVYYPKYQTKAEAFATNDMIAREQWISHICSEKCWNEFLGR